MHSVLIRFASLIKVAEINEFVGKREDYRTSRIGDVFKLNIDFTCDEERTKMIAERKGGV